ncbi:tRNA threonylcarbamoyladenosine dehydratase [Polynucleobacter sp. MWH-CaK5]|uniref:tRNA threonylcarbamoyladenosine dehydratase n=1 Tax=Polynucleobacter sp. MWH-CaK5 TaxID=2689107 RepID=UPI001BFE6858|nr:tRNA threonylcarbamoyladenosine dehydratase [Polynucleobacter sp. MWH-CaK5]QWD89327.1 tRNA threonylcarbamoyladenosine dehydratase [Polynucleobacter sp. MWH-CaK5]
MAMDTNQNTNQNRRFAGVARLYGETGLQAFERAHVLVAGLGGVGSWAVEALARSGIGELTLMDFDHIAVSNVNRQLHAIEDNFGKSKSEAMAERVRQINPLIKLNIIDEFLTPDNLDAYLRKNAENPYFAVLDATDDVKMKIALAAYCEGRDELGRVRVAEQKEQEVTKQLGKKSLTIPLIICGGAGGKLDPSRIKAADLAKTTQDPVLSKIRYSLRKEYGFSSDPKKKLGVTAIYSDEPRQGVASGGLSCAGYGSAVTVTATFGFIAAAEVLKLLQKQQSNLEK